LLTFAPLSGGHQNPGVILLVDPELLRAFAAEVNTASAAIRSADVGHKATTAADGIPGSTAQ
jgi:hypothetical protein